MNDETQPDVLGCLCRKCNKVHSFFDDEESDPNDYDVGLENPE